mgnify:FL=1
MACLIDLLDYIETKGEKYVTIYVGIGSSAKYSVQQDSLTGMYKIDPKQEQEYPMFLSTLKSKYPTHPVYIILIDPALEDPPFVVCDSHNKLDTSYWSYDEKINIFNSEGTNIHVIPVRISVTYDFYSRHEPEALNITIFFDKLNELSIKNNWLSILHDFSGKNIALMAERYDELLKYHKNHIIYGLGVRRDESCCINLILPMCNFVFTKQMMDLQYLIHFVMTKI